MHASKFQGVFFLRSPKRRRQLGHRHKGLGPRKSTKIDENQQKSTKLTIYVFETSRGVFFLRSPKRRRQLGHRHKGFGDPKLDEHSRKSFILVQRMTISHFNVDVLQASHMHTNISHVWIFINLICYESACPLISINVIFY